MKGYELIKEITEGKIKDNTQIEVHDLSVLDKWITNIEYKNRRLNWEEETFDTSYLLNPNCYFRVIEEQEDIDIQSIEEIKDIFIENSSCGEDVKYLARKYNEILKAVKQLEKKIKEKE